MFIKIIKFMMEQTHVPRQTYLFCIVSIYMCGVDCCIFLRENQSNVNDRRGEAKPQT